MGLMSKARSFLGFRAPKAKSLTNTADAGWLNTAWPNNWWQMGYSGRPIGNGPVVEACISAYAQTISQLSLRLYRKNPDGGRTLITSQGDSKYSNIARLLHRPNTHQTRSDFILNLIYSLMLDGNAYYYADGDPERPNSLWLLNSRETQAHRANTGDVFYTTGGTFSNWAEVPASAIIPERFIGHMRLHTPQDPLIGVTPINAAIQSIAANQALTSHQATFFSNMTRPSGFLSTDLDINAEQMQQMRTAWENQAKDLNSGGLPILASGMKYNPMSITSQDAQLVEAWKMSVEDISRVFRVPLPLINSMENSTLNNSETLMNFWLSSGLGFMLRHTEEKLEMFFDLDERYEIEFDTDRLLRADLQGRMEALGTAVTKGIYSPNEARKKEGLPEVEGGDMPRVQAQMIPLDAVADTTIPTATPTAPDVDTPINERMMSDLIDHHLEFEDAA